MATSGQTHSGSQSRANKATSANRKSRYIDSEGLIPTLAKTVREVEKAAAKHGKVPAGYRNKYLVVAMLMREERARVLAGGVPDSERTETLKRLDGIAGILAQTAARDTSLIQLLESTEPLSAAMQEVKRDLLLRAGVELETDDLIVTTPEPELPAVPDKQVVPQSVTQRSMLNPFLAPDFSRTQSAAKPSGRKLGNWELLGPLFKAFEQGAGGSAASMKLPEPSPIDRLAPAGRQLMEHQAEFISSVRGGHRTFLLADEPGLGKTAQSILAAAKASAYPMLAVVPNVVKMNWAREVNIWTPNRKVSVIHGDGNDLDAFADVVVVNYDILDRHIGWLSRLGFKSMVVDEAHFIKNPESQRTKNVLKLADSIRMFAPGGDPLLIALTGTPLINSIEDFRMIWRFLGWIDDKGKPTAKLMESLEANDLTPLDFGFLPAARKTVIDMGIVRRRKIDVASDLPSRRIADIPVELEGSLGNSIREAGKQLAERLYRKYLQIRETKPNFTQAEIVKIVAASELEDSKSTGTGENVFAMVRRIGQAKASLAADYTAQLADAVGKVVFFAKHIDVMDLAEETLAKRGLKTVSIRGDQSANERQDAIDAFTNDPNVSVIVCSLTAAGVGVNLQVASNVVLAELSWTAAEQDQAIDRVHRIGQEEPVTAWRILAAQTIDTKIAELIDSKAGLAQRALEGSSAELELGNIQLLALSQILEETIKERG
ncbi:MAG: DEAD/DEAH box helicase [Microbacteriaceae bacterium]